MSLWQGRASKAVGTAVIALAALVAVGSPAFARGGHGGYHHGGGYHHSGSFYHRGYGSGFGFPGARLGGYGYSTPYYGSYSPYYGTGGYSVPGYYRPGYGTWGGGRFCR